MKKKILLILSVMIVIILTGCIKKKKTEETKYKDVFIVPTMQDFIYENTFWTPTFQLIWNDLKNKIAKGTIKSDEKIDIVNNLNLEEFTEKMISDDYYYKTYGLKTLSLKKQIEDSILKKFNQKSDILDDFNWDDDELDQNQIDKNRFFLYSMLYRKFDYKYKFDVLKSGNFKSYKDIKYFGIDSKSDSKLYNQVEVLYYNNQDDLAVKLKTLSKDDVILVKNPQGKNFSEIYENLKNKSKDYKGNKSFSSSDKLKIPYLKIDGKKVYTELENKKFYNDNNEEIEIIKAIQTVKLSLTELGGEIKSEAAIDGFVTSAVPDKFRNFYFDDTFAIFLKEEEKEVPYFAGIINDITKFQ